MFIACFPKSGSTYLMSVLHEITGFPRVFPIAGISKPGSVAAANQDFCECELRKIRYQDGVCHQHLTATVRNLALAKEHGIRPVILVRNVFDVVPSVVDHLHRECRIFATGFVPTEFFKWSPLEQETFVVSVQMPWYFNFLLSWQEAQVELPVYWLSYERLFSDQRTVLREVCEFWDYPVAAAEIESAIERVQTLDTRFNKGQSGRGKLLDPRNQAALHELGAACRLPEQLKQLVGLHDCDVARRIEDDPKKCAA
jgi:hypothetical protein